MSEHTVAMTSVRENGSLFPPHYLHQYESFFMSPTIIVETYIIIFNTHGHYSYCILSIHCTKQHCESVHEVSSTTFDLHAWLDVLLPSVNFPHWQIKTCYHPFYRLRSHTHPGFNCGNPIPLVVSTVHSGNHCINSLENYRAKLLLTP